MTTFDMVTTIYWKSNFSQDSSIKYVLKYKCDPPPWTSVSCPRPQWHGNSSEMSCILLTCATSPLNVYCQIEVEAHGNSSTPFVTRSVLYNAYDKSMFGVFLVKMMGQIITVTKLNCTSYEPRWTIRKNCLKTFCSNPGLIRDDPYWNSRKNSLELIELSSINKVSLV